MERLQLKASCCREIPRQLRGNVNVTCNTDFSAVLWSKYKWTKYDKVDTTFESNPYLVDSEFAIEKVLLSKDSIACLDCSGNININTISTTPQSQVSSTFEIVKQDVIACELMNNNYVVCLVIKDEHTELSVNDFNEDFSQNKLFSFRNPYDSDWRNAPRNKNIISIEKISHEFTEQIRRAFDVDICGSHHFLTVICLDKINVYACVLSGTYSSNVKLVKLYKSQSELIGINVSTENGICVLIGLSGGNIIKVPLNRDEPKVIYQNTALYKFACIQNAVIYTDGLTMWKIEDVFSNPHSNPKQFCVKNVRDFCVVKDKIVCTTFSNLFYCFCINDIDNYKQPSDCAGQLDTNSYLDKMMSVVEENEKLVQQINREKQYLMALSLSNRQTIMDDLIQVSSSFFESFKDVEEIKDITLTDSRDAYSDTQSYYFMIKISIIPIQHKLNTLLSNVLGDIKIHITLFSHIVLQTTSIKINGQLKESNFVIPLKRSRTADAKEVQAFVKIVTNIPGKMDEKQKQWIILYRKCIDFNSENFRSATYRPTSICLKEEDTPLETLICNSAKHLHGARYRFELIDRQEVSIDMQET